MNAKQKVNDKCLCGSGKKYKKCCINKPNSNVIPIHTYLPPQTLTQSITRHTLDILMENITDPHCKICGDIENDCKILKIPTQIGNIYLCEFCYNVQSKM
jgi:hypothetical protein